jgi:hypothetical protein
VFYTGCDGDGDGSPVRIGTTVPSALPSRTIPPKKRRNLSYKSIPSMGVEKGVMPMTVVMNIG